METFANNLWATIGVSFLVGFFVGYILLRATKGGVQKNIQLEAELKAAQAKIEEQKQQLEQHFSTSADLLSTLADDYKKLYAHLANTSEQLLPEASQKIAFFQQAQLPSKPITEEDQPKDYSEGSSGLLK